MLEDGVAFAGVAKFPARVKCALLSWMAWKDATAQASSRRRRHDQRQHRAHRRPRGPPDVPAAGGTATVTVDDVIEAMKDVVDPELGINVVDLGLVYGVHVDDDNVADARHDAHLGGLPADRRHRGPDQRPPWRASSTTWRINWVWMPPWGPDKITDDGREQLRALGFNV